MYEVKGIHYNTLENFREKKSHYCYAKIGSITKGNVYSPDGGTALDLDLSNSIKKAYSEAMERRLLITQSDSNIQVNCINLITGDFEQVNQSNFFYDDSTNIIDTTGCAVHPHSEQAMKKAVEELLQKNSVMFMWYYGVFSKTLRKEKHLINAMFFPWITVLMWKISDNEKLIITGMGTDRSVEKAYEKAYNEMLLLEKQYETNVICGNSNNLESYKHKSILSQLDTMYNEAEIKAYSSEKSNNDWINEMKRLPRWVKTLYCYPVKCYDKRIKVVKVYSDELITCLPTISNLEKSKQMNQIFNVFGKLDFSKVRDCLVL